MSDEPAAAWLWSPSDEPRLRLRARAHTAQVQLTCELCRRSLAALLACSAHWLANDLGELASRRLSSASECNKSRAAFNAF